MASKDTIDKLNRLEFFYWCKPPKTPEVLEQDKEDVKRDFALIRNELEVLEILLASLLKKPITNGTDSSKMILLDSESYDKIKELLGNDR